MKSTCLTFTFSLLLLLSSLGLKAQNSITLSFNSTSNIDSVRIDNLDNASYKVLKDGTFSILLQFGLPNKIESINVFGEPLVYPNPFKQQVNFEFSSINHNNVNLAVYDLSGKVVAQFNQKIDVGSHRFTFRPAKPGVYLMKVSDKSNVYTSTIICQESSSGQSGIEYSGLVDAPKSKSPQMVRANAPNSSTGFSANFGDLLRFTGYSGTKINSMYDFANSTKKYTFTFTDRYFKFKNYNIQASKPCFVDVMFSVTDQNNKGVDYLTNSDFSVLEDNAPTSPSETFRYVRKMQQIPSKIKTVLLLDNSTSVAADIEAIKNAAIKFVQTIREGQEIAIYVFSDTPVLLQNFTTNKNLLETAIKSIGSGYPSTNLYGSIITGLSIWNDIYTSSSITQGSLIVFTDGSDTQGSSTLNSVISSRGDKKIYVIGLGGEINPTALNQIANPGPYYPIQKAGELDAVFAAIQSDIVQFSNSFYWLNYMSPKRTGTHTLKVSASNNTNTSSTSYLTGSFSTSGFQSVKSGVYANIDDNHLYGLDTIRCYYSSDEYRFYDANNFSFIGKDSLVLKPLTYWAYKPPVYSWTIEDNNVYQTSISAYSQLTIKPKEAKSDTSIITLRDEANNYTKKIVVIFNPITNTVTDIDGNVYHTVTIGTQTWMVENLKTTRYRNGDPITEHRAYNNDANNAAKYGRLYTWYAATDSRGIAPAGWHVPTDAEWTILENYLIANGYNYDGTTTGSKIAKALAATTDWNTNTGTGTIGNDLTKNNSSGFTALPGGIRHDSGSFYYVGDYGYWWSSTEYDTTYAWYRYPFYDYYSLVRNYHTKSYGFSVRCLRD